MSKGFSDRAHDQDLKMKDIEITGLTEKVTDLKADLENATKLVSNANSNVAEIAAGANKR